jgi:hypothetical protein
MRLHLLQWQSFLCAENLPALLPELYGRSFLIYFIHCSLSSAWNSALDCDSVIQCQLNGYMLEEGNEGKDGGKKKEAGRKGREETRAGRREGVLNMLSAFYLLSSYLNEMEPPKGL